MLYRPRVLDVSSSASSGLRLGFLASGPRIILAFLFLLLLTSTSTFAHSSTSSSLPSPSSTTAQTTPSLAQASTSLSTSLFPRGSVISRVNCTAAPGQSYSLYLPSHYSPDRAWPVVFAFDFAARGHLPVSLMRDAAERYGYILVGSNTARNGPFKWQEDAADAMMRDVTARFSIDPRRIYLAGFSGGARAALTLALMHNGGVAGVLANSAGLPTELASTEKFPFVVYALTGDSDFNFPEVSNLAARLRSLSVPVQFSSFSGPHTWAPSSHWVEAFEWLDLQAIRSGRLPPHPRFVRWLYTRGLQRAIAMAAAHDDFHAWQAFSDLVASYSGLLDVSYPAQRAAGLASSPSVRRAHFAEQADFALQQEFSRPVFLELTALTTDPASRPAARAHLREDLAALQLALDHSADPRRIRVLERSLEELFYQVCELADVALESANPSLADDYIALAIFISPKAPLPQYLLARFHLLHGKPLEAMRALDRAFWLGFDSPELLLIEDEFASVRYNREFLILLGLLAQ